MQMHDKEFKQAEEIPLSEMMTLLYGAQDAGKIYKRCQALDPIFNKFVQRTIYDWLWKLPPLSLKEKSLATIVSLITLGKEEQTAIHLIGFLNISGSTNAALEIIKYMFRSGYIVSFEKIYDILLNVLEEKGLRLKMSIAEDVLKIKSTLSAHDQALISLAACIALGDQEKTKACMKKLLNKKILSIDEIKGIIRHQMIYCGCPCTMNGFAALQTVTNSL